MNCEEVQRELVALIQGELPKELEPRVREHLGSCRPCSEELASFEETLRVAREMEMIEPSAQFRASLERRLAEALARQKARSSRVHLRAVERAARPWGRLLDQVRRSPIFAVSALAHALLLIALANFFLLSSPPERGWGAPAQTAKRFHLRQDRRARAPQYATRLAGRTLDVGTIAESGTLHLVGSTVQDEECIWVYNEAQWKTVCEKSDSALVPFARECPVAYGKIDIPEDLYEQYVKDAPSVTVLALESHGEIWSTERFGDYKAIVSPSLAGTGAPPAARVAQRAAAPGRAKA